MVNKDRFEYSFLSPLHHDVRLLQDSSGLWHSNRSKVGNLLVNQFKSLYTSSSPLPISTSAALFTPLVTEADNTYLCKVSDDLKIMVVVKQLGATKAPGPNGMTVTFYQRYWKTVGYSVTTMVRSYF